MGEVLATLVMAAHLLCVNVSGAGPLVCLWLEWREARGDAAAGRLGRRLAWASVTLLLVGIALGVVLGALLWTDDYVAILKRLPSKVHGGIWELLFSLVLGSGYAAWWGWSKSSGTLARCGRGFLSLLSGTNLLYHFPVLFVMISQMSVAGETGDVISSAEFRGRLVDGELASRYVHFLLSAFAVTGIWMMLEVVGRRSQYTAEEADRWIAWSGRLALVPTIAQLAVGTWVVTQLSPTARHRVSGDDPLTTILFVVSVLLALFMMHLLAKVAFRDRSGGACVKAAVAMVAVVVLMCATARSASSPPAKPPVETRSNPVSTWPSPAKSVARLAESHK